MEVSEIRESPARVTLSDGTVLRLKIDVIDAVRFDGTWDAEGHPIYNVRNGVTIAVLDCPDNLKRPENKRVQ